MGKKLRMLWGGVVGATLQYLYDPQSGKSRRARLKDQAAARVRDATREISRKARYQRGRLRGVAHEITSDWRGDDQRAEDDISVLQGIQNAGNSRYH
jgi:hypothetical protein